MFLLVLFCVVCGAAMAQTALYYENDGVVNCPPEVAPQVDALNFINRGVFNVTFTNATLNSQLFDTANTVNFTNYGTMFGGAGFELLTTAADNGNKRMAANIHNEGTITCGSDSNFIPVIGGTAFLFGALPKFIAAATNFANSGDISMGFEGLCSITAKNLDLERGGISMLQNGIFSINGSTFNNQGIFDGYWGVDTNIINPAFLGFLPPSSPGALVTTRNNQPAFRNLNLPNGLAYLDDQTINSNRTVRAVFLSNTNADIQVNVYFPYPALPYFSVVEWTLPTTNLLGLNSTNYLYLLDYFGVDPTWGLFLNGFAGAGMNRLTYQPANYSLFETPNRASYGQPAAPTVIPFGTFNNSIVTNQNAAYQAIFLPTSVMLGDIANQDVTNIPGRITIRAENNLNLTRSRISSLNYLDISSPDTFHGSDGARIASPYSDVHLRSTNGTLVITNMMTPTVPRREGTIDMMSLRWTNEFGGITNTYHVLYVDTKLAPFSPTRIQDLVLRSTNAAGGPNSIYIKDVLNVTRSLLLDCTDLTISTNEPGSPAACGAINLMNANVIWSPSTPRLQYLTNDGVIQTWNSVFFGGSRSAPFYSATYNEPYKAFVNRGNITNFASLIWANEFQNSGVFNANSGAIRLQSCRHATLTNGTFLAQSAYGYGQLETGDLLVSNHVINVAGALTLTVTNVLDDGSLTSPVALVTNKNAWTVGSGINLPILPAGSSLLATTVTNISTSYHPNRSTWAGMDKGADPNGFSRNGGLGRLILDGRDADSIFTFAPATGANAIYIDYLQLDNSVATNVDGLGTFRGLQVLPGMKVYYGQALANGVSVAEKLSGRNGFVWVSNYHTGFYSSTNVVYPDGSTNRLNTALVTSCDIDSDGDGIVNCMDPAPIPIFSPASVALAARIMEAAPKAAAISWNTLPNSTNYLYAASSPYASDWQLVTNFTVGTSGGRVTVAEPVQTNSVRFYRVRVGAPQP
jgi:hypothetical protein